MSEENKAVVRRVIAELWNKGRIEVIDELYAPDYRDRSSGMPPGITPDREGQKQFAQMFRGAFPDMVGTVQDEIAAGDKVVVRWAAHATHQGEFMGIPATRKKIVVNGTSIYRLAGGQIVEEWTEADMMGLMTQLGAIPEPAIA